LLAAVEQLLKEQDLLPAEGYLVDQPAE